MNIASNCHVYSVKLFGKTNQVVCPRELSLEEQRILRRAADLITGEDSDLLVGFDPPDLMPLLNAKNIIAIVARANTSNAAGSTAATELAEVLKQASMIVVLVTMPVYAGLDQLEAAVVPLSHIANPTADILFGSNYGEGANTEIAVLAVPSV